MLIRQVNAFTDEPFKGNPAGVCVVNDFPDDAMALKIAAEMGYSETAFVKKLDTGHYRIRWFSPKDEAPLCGHATLAAAHSLWETGAVETNRIAFESLSGPLLAQKENGAITLNFPSFAVDPCPMPELLNKALGYVAVASVHKDELVYVVELSSVEAVKNLKPNFEKIAELPCRAVSVTAYNDGEIDPEIDFVSRYFAPKVGIPEDPVCGSSHCRLTPFWAAKTGKTRFNAMQVSKRTGFIEVAIVDNRVTLTAKAVTVARGEAAFDANQSFIAIL